MPKKKQKISKIDLDHLKDTPVITVDKASDYSFEFFSEKNIEQVTITDLNGKIVHESEINEKKFVFNYFSNCKDMFLLKIKKEKQKKETGIMIL